MNYIQKYKAALKLNRWPMIDYVKQAEKEPVSYTHLTLPTTPYV